MKKLARDIAIRLRVLIDIILACLAIPSAIVLISIRRFGIQRLNLSRRVLMNLGVYPIRDRYYEPLFNPEHLRIDLNEDRCLPGLDLKEGEQIRLLKSLNYSQELIDLNWQRNSSELMDFSLENPSFLAGDAEFLYQFLRHTRPRRLIEIGSGHSTKIARLALNKNRDMDGIECQHTCVEPYEMSWLESLGVDVIRKKVEDCPMALFEELEAGDMLFIDSSHMIRPQGDVLFEYLEILPKLKTGVNVHIHDIFTPRDYLHKWIVEDIKFWNEQYLMEALLSNSSKFTVVAALNFLTHKHFEEMKAVCPYLTIEHEPGSFYLRA